MLIVAKLLIIIFCGFLQFHIYPLNTTSTLITLVAFILTCLTLILKPDKACSKTGHVIISTAWLAFLVFTLFNPAAGCYIPLAAFDICSMKLKLTGIIWLISLMYQLGSKISENIFPSDAIFIIIISLCAIILQYLITMNQKHIHELKAMRDTSKEHELLIEDKNRRLIEQQDSDLYMAKLKERNRIAREIHDNVGHMLTRSILQVGAIKTINSNEILNEPLEGLHETLNAAMTNIRNSVHDLHDESIDLRSAIEEIIESVHTPSINFDYDMSNNVAKSVKYCFITITKEAINNTIKHSNATKVNILMQEHPAFYQLMIYDNGTDININPTEGIGLTNMRDRVKSLRGNIKISTDNGFKILISIIKSNLSD